jgi:glycosyltransferase involved in cell wall biosynthesis
MSFTRQAVAVEQGLSADVNAQKSTRRFCESGMPRALLNVHQSPMRSPLRIAILNSHPIQYFAPLYAYINSVPDLDVTVLYLSDISLRGGTDLAFNRTVKWDIDLLSGYKSLLLGNATIREPRGFFSLVAPEVWSELRSGRYDVLWLHGHNYAANLIALAAAKSMRIPVLMRGETHDRLARSWLKVALRKPLLRMLYGCCDRLLAIGTANAHFYASLGVPQHKTFLVPYAVDNDRFIRGSRISMEEKRKIRRQYNLPAEVPIVLYAAKLTARKRPLDLLAATVCIKAKSAQRFTVLIVGSGELEIEMRNYCAERNLNNVVFAGFVNQAELPSLYGASDIFVLPSQDEPWGLAVNEAMCAGLPVIVSREAGCVSDLVEDGVNGFTPQAGDIEALAESLQRLIEERELRRRFGQSSLTRISSWGYQACLEGLRAAVWDFHSGAPERSRCGG